MLTAHLETRFSPLVQIVRRRLLPVPGEVLVRVGDRVQPDDVVARANVEGPLRVIDAAQALGVSAQEAMRSMRVAVGQAVGSGDVLASARPTMFRRVQVKAPCAGTIQGLTDGLIFLRQPPQELRLSAYMPGEVTEVYPHRGVAIRGVAALVRGVWGSGRETRGLLAAMVGASGDVLTWDRVGLRYRGTILIGGILEDPQVLLRASRFRIAGLIVGSMLPGLRPLCAQLGLPVIVTEGMGRIPMAEPIFQLLRSHHGRRAVLCGAAPDAGNGPEVIVPLAEDTPSMALIVSRPIEVGARVRITRPPYLGAVGQVVAIPTGAQETTIGTRADGAEVRLADGRRVFVPGVNMELLG